MGYLFLKFILAAILFGLDSSGPYRLCVYCIPKF